MSAVTIVDDYVASLAGETRRLAHGEWGITIAPDAAGGWPLDVGIRVADGMLLVRAFALPADERVNPWNFLHWNRSTRFVRFACTRAGDIWVHGDVPVAAVDERMVDRLLGLVAEGAIAARAAMMQQASPAPAAEPEAGGWGALGG